MLEQAVTGPEACLSSDWGKKYAHGGDTLEEVHAADETSSLHVRQNISFAKGHVCNPTQHIENPLL